MANGNGQNTWAFLKNWGWALFIVIGISTGIATLAGHSNDKDIHMTTIELDSRYVPREIFQLEMNNIKLRMADQRKLTEKIWNKLDSK